MKRILIRNVSAVVITVALLFTTAFSLNIMAGALTFTPRFEEPSYDNPYYSAPLNVFSAYGYGLPNCTAYAWGRAYEITGTRPQLSTGNAENWFPYNQSTGAYDYGWTPRLGAIACWSYPGGGGHVAVVEQIDSDGTMYLSNSAWSARYGTCPSFYITEANIYDSNPGGSSWWNFQGYIYVIDSPDVVLDPSVYDDSGTDYSTGYYKTNVNGTLNLRSGAGTNYSSIASIPNGVELTVTDVKSSGGNVWGETTYKGKSGWVALSYCTFTGSFSDDDDNNDDPYEDDYFTESTTTAFKPTLPRKHTEPVTEPTTEEETVPMETVAIEPTEEPTTEEPTTEEPTTVAPTTIAPTTLAPTTIAPTTIAPTTVAPVTIAPTRPVKADKIPAPVGGLGVGDVDGDGMRDIKDVTMIQRYVAMGEDSLSPELIAICDFDFDGKATISDATRIQHYITFGY